MSGGCCSWPPTSVVAGAHAWTAVAATSVSRLPVDLKMKTRDMSAFPVWCASNEKRRRRGQADIRSSLATATIYARWIRGLVLVEVDTLKP